MAVDLGSHSIKLARFKKSKAAGAKPDLEFIRRIEINQQEIPVDEEARKSYLMHLLRADFGVSKIKGPLVALSISGSSVLVREVKLPALHRSALRQTLAVEAEPYIPFDIQDVYLDYHIIEEIMDKGEKKYSVLLIAAKKDLVQNKLGLLSGVGARPAVVDVDSLSIANLVALSPEIKGGSFVVCNIGASITSVVVLDKGIPRLVRDVAIGGGVFTRAMQKETGLPPDQAEQAKREMGLVFEEEQIKNLEAQGDPKKLQAAKAMVQAATDLLSEVGKSMTFYLTHGVESKINKVYITGGGALLKNLPGFAAKQLKMPVEIFNPFSVIALPPEAGVDAALGPMFGVVCGLALRRWDDWATG